MSEQPTLLPAGPGTIQARFERFHELNPWVYHKLVELAHRLQQRGLTRLGINMLWEVLRWQYYETTTDPSSGYHLNDHYPSRYVRLIVAREPDLKNCFQLRKLHTD